MDLNPYIDSLRRQVFVAAEAGGTEARELAERLVTPLDAAIRLTLQDALASAAEEITVELAPGSVELRLRGREPEFVVTPPPMPDAPAREADDVAPLGWRALASGSLEGEEGGTARINVRMPDHLKARVEEAAARDGVSVNAWLVRAAAAALERSDPERRRERRASRGSQRYTGWAR